MTTQTRFTVWVQPRASRTEIAGRHGDDIKIRLAAPPVDGAANEALIRFLAEKLGVPRSAVSIVGGLSGRLKRVRVEGKTEEEVEGKLGRLAGLGGRTRRARKGSPG